jgi:hypothetical protein
MNLVKIQEELKGFPTQTIMAYVNGSNPEVPPYMALSELDRRKRMEQRKAEPPTQSVKEKLESEVTNPQGIAQLPQAQQGAPQDQPPQGQPGMPQGQPGMPAPQQMAAQQMPPPGMAAGGIARIPVRDDMFNYAPGGIVAFAGNDESLVTELTPEDMGAFRGPMGDIIPRRPQRTALNPFPGPTGSIPGEELHPRMVGYHNPMLDLPGAVESSNKGAQPDGIAALPETAELQDLVPNAAQRLKDTLLGKNNYPKVQTKEEIRNILIAEAMADGNIEKAKMLSQIPGDSLVPLIRQLNKENEEQRAEFKEGQGRMGLAALSNALIAAGEATRGRREPGFFAGTGDALGGFGKSYNDYTAEDVKRLAAQKATQRAQTIEVATLQAKVDDLRAANATGTVLDRQEAQKAVQEQAIKMQTMQMGAADKILAQALEESKAKTTADYYTAKGKNDALQLEAQIARYKEQAAEAARTAADRKRQLDMLEETRPTAEDKAIARVESNLNRDEDYKEVLKRLAGIPLADIDGPEAQFLRASRDAIRNDAFKRAKLDAPPARTLPKLSDFVKPEVEEPGFFSRIFGSGSKPKAVPFDQLPK